MHRSDLHPDPLEQFRVWFAQAPSPDAGAHFEPNAMTLATADDTGAVSARIVLLKGFDRRGFVFFSNYHSRKGVQLSHNATAALLFYWPHRQQQIRIEGSVQRLAEQESDGYFASRPRISQLGAWASPQSSPIASRAFLEQRVEQFQQRYNDTAVPRPDHWGGYLLGPVRMEFWQAQQFRLHDRFCYTLNGAVWTLERLAP
jgi:pyridoxamine 5'-phosphate oxidase